MSLNETPSERFLIFKMYKSNTVQFLLGLIVLIIFMHRNYTKVDVGIKYELIC